MILISDTWPGNVHATAHSMNKLDLAHYVQSIVYDEGNYSTLLLNVPNSECIAVYKKLGKWNSLTDDFKAEVENWAKRKNL